MQMTVCMHRLGMGIFGNFDRLQNRLIEYSGGGVCAG